jgi:hypothetical protein
MPAIVNVNQHAIRSLSLAFIKRATGSVINCSLPSHGKRELPLIRVLHKINTNVFVPNLNDLYRLRVSLRGDAYNLDPAARTKVVSGADA